MLHGSNLTTVKLHEVPERNNKGKYEVQNKFVVRNKMEMVRRAGVIVVATVPL